VSIFTLSDCRIFDGHALVSEQGSVVVEGDRIVEVRTQPGGAIRGHEIAAGGHTLMPGLIDAHVHVYAYEASLIRNEQSSSVARTLHAEQVMESALNRGFTTLRDAGGADRDLADALADRMFNGPRLFYSGKALSQTGGHGDFRVSGIRMCGCGNHMGVIGLIADGEVEVRKAAREQLRWGATQIKIMASGGAASPSDPISMIQYTEAEISAAVEEARRWETYVMAHAYTPEAISRCIRLGVRTIEHGNHIDAKTAAEVRDRGAYVVPTLSTYSSLVADGARLGWAEPLVDKIRQVEAAGLEALRILVAHGAKIGFGSDLLGRMHVDQCNEFTIRSQVQAPVDILRSATAINAEMMLQENELGCISPGAKADLILVNGDPLHDITLFDANGSNVPLVMINGEIRKDRLGSALI